MTSVYIQVFNRVQISLCDSLTRGISGNKIRQVQDEINEIRLPVHRLVGGQVWLPIIQTLNRDHKIYLNILNIVHDPLS